MKSGLKMLFLALFLAGFASGAAAQAQQMYQWTDEDGVVHFSQTPPPNEVAEQTVVPKGAEKMGQAPVEGATATDMPSAAQQKRENLARKRDQAQADAAIRDAACAAKRAEVARLEPNRRVFYTDANGETVRMDDEARVAQVAAAKRYIQENCN
jgi:hypothetical protein